VEGRLLVLGRRRGAEDLRGGGLIEAGWDVRFADRVEQPQGAATGDVERVLGDVEGNPDVALGTEVVDLLWLQLVDQTGQRDRVREVAVVREELRALLVGVAEEVLDAAGVEARRAPDDAVNLVALLEQKLGQVRAVLAGQAREQRALRGFRSHEAGILAGPHRGGPAPAWHGQ